VKIIREVVFYASAAAVILPTPVLILAWMTGQTLEQILYR
jgi:hypothetical protein